jgi:hypothetical protein
MSLDSFSFLSSAANFTENEETGKENLVNIYCACEDG